MGKKDKVLISFLLDRTGSMSSVRNDVIGGFNEFLDEQSKQEGDCKFVFTLFDTDGIDIKEYASIKEVPKLTLETYVPRSMTNLLDAIGRTADYVSSKKLPKRVLFVIYTDGHENASHEWTRAGIKKLIEQKQKDGWEFLFIGADIDAYSEAGSIGVPAGQTFSTTGQGTNNTMSAASQSTVSYRQGNAEYTAPLKEAEKRQKK